MAPGDKVRVVRPIQTYHDEWFLPGETLYLLHVGSDYVRVRCPVSGADGWLAAADVVAVEESKTADLHPAPFCCRHGHATEVRLAGDLAQAAVEWLDALDGVGDSVGAAFWRMAEAAKRYRQALKESRI